MPEEDLVLWCLASHALGDGLGPATPAIEAELVWDRVIATTVKHRVVPGVLAGLRQLGGRVPVAALEQLEADDRRHRATTGAVRAMVGEILRASEQTGVRILPYKGEDIARSAYGDPHGRQYRDLDMLVRRRDAASAVAMLESLGYSVAEGQRAWPRAAYMRVNHEYTLRRPGSPEADLHWGLAPPYLWSPDLEFMWARLTTARWGQDILAALCPEDMLLMASVHGMRHGWQWLRLVTDVAGLVRNERHLDYEAVISDARRTRCAHMVAVGLELSRLLLGMDLPEIATEFVAADPTATRLASDRAARIFSHDGHKYSRLELAEFQLASLDRARDRGRYRARIAAQYVTQIGVRLFAEPEGSSGSGVKRGIRQLSRPLRLLGRYGLDREALRRVFRF